MPGVGHSKETAFVLGTGTDNIALLHSGQLAITIPNHGALRIGKSLDRLRVTGVQVGISAKRHMRLNRRPGFAGVSIASWTGHRMVKKKRIVCDLIRRGRGNSRGLLISHAVHSLYARAFGSERALKTDTTVLRNTGKQSGLPHLM